MFKEVQLEDKKRNEYTTTFEARPRGGIIIGNIYGKQEIELV